MPAANEESLFDLATPINAAFQSALDGVGLSAFAQRADGSIATPCASVKFIPSEATGHQKRLLDGRHFKDQWRGVLGIAIRTHRKANTASHASYVQLAEKIAHDYDSYIDMDYHQIQFLEKGAPDEIAFDEEKLHDITLLQFNLIVRIKNDAWPT